MRINLLTNRGLRTRMLVIIGSLVMVGLVAVGGWATLTAFNEGRDHARESAKALAQQAALGTSAWLTVRAQPAIVSPLTRMDLLHVDQSVAQRAVVRPPMVMHGVPASAEGRRSQTSPKSRPAQLEARRPGTAMHA